LLPAQLHPVQRTFARQGHALILNPPPLFPAGIIFVHQHR
jgi:hypothetical protein